MQFTVYEGECRKFTRSTGQPTGGTLPQPRATTPGPTKGRTVKPQKKAILAGLTAIAAGAAMVACSSDDGTGGGGDGSAVINAYGCEPQSPLLSTDTNEACGGNIIDVLYTGLVTYDVNGETDMAVAESIEANDDATEFTIKLRDDWTFTNGEAVTADSFIDAWNYAAASKNAQKQQ